MEIARKGFNTLYIVSESEEMVICEVWENGGFYGMIIFASNKEEAIKRFLEG